MIPSTSTPPSNPSRTPEPSPAPATIPGEEVAQGYRRLMHSLEISLAAGQNAVLTGNLATLERCTREQSGLCQELRTALQNGIARENTKRGAGTKPWRKPDPAISAGLGADVRGRALALRQALLVYGAVLVRAQLHLRVLANMLAGTSADYGPPPAAGAEPTHSTPWRKAG